LVVTLPIISLRGGYTSDARPNTKRPTPTQTMPLRLESLAPSSRAVSFCAAPSSVRARVELLLQQGVDQEERNYMLERAVGDGNFEVIKLLVEYGADPKRADFEDVCRTGHPFIIKF